VVDVKRVGVDGEIDRVLTDEADASLGLIQSCDELRSLLGVESLEEQRRHRSRSQPGMSREASEAAGM
jgi:hypothetical protein